MSQFPIVITTFGIGIINGRKLARLHETDLQSLIEEELRK
jgi:hypothetical protein